MDTIFMKNSETSDPHRLLLNVTDKNKLKEKRLICCFIKS